MIKFGGNIVIRCDANEINGFGHLSRCINTALGIRAKQNDCRIRFYGDYTDKAVSLIEKHGFEHILYNSHNHESSENLIKFIDNSSHFILDTYLITQNYIDGLCNRNFRFIIFDDFFKFDLTRVNLVINYSIGADNHNYGAAHQALGLKYYPVKPALKIIRETNIKAATREYRSILVMIGSYDKYGIGSHIAEIIDSLVSGKTITYINAKNCTYFPKNNDLISHAFYENIENIYAKTDIAITGGGLSKFECAYCCIPVGVVAQNEGEFEETMTLDRNNLCRTVGRSYNFDDEAFTASFKNLLNPDTGRLLHSSSAKSFDSQSLENLADKIINA